MPAPGWKTISGCWKPSSPNRSWWARSAILQPDKPEFGEYLERYAKNPLYRGIRYGNLWGYDMVKQVDNPAFIDGLKLAGPA